MNHAKCLAYNSASVQNHLGLRIKTIILTKYQVTHNFIPVHDSLQTVCDCYDTRILPKLMSKRQLNGIISFVVYLQVNS
jgi:hypothetical protein